MKKISEKEEKERMYDINDELSLIAVKRVASFECKYGSSNDMTIVVL